MSSSSRTLHAAAAVLALGCAWSSRANAQEQARGFAVERLYTSAPGAGWFVMDDLDIHGGLGGAFALTGGYAHVPLRIASPDGTQRVDVVKDQAFATASAAVTYDRFRVYIDVTKPMVVKGDSGTVGNYQFTGPYTDAGHAPDLFSDIRLGLDARVIGRPRGPFRLGVGVQVIIPSGDRPDYVTDGNFRGMARLLFAGDVGHFTYAGQLGVHMRDLDEPAPGSPQGSELLWGVAAGARFPVLRSMAIVVGPELFGETSFKSFFGANSTGVEALLGARLEGTSDEGPQLRVKLGTGVGLDQRFGVPEWRFVFAIEAFGSVTRAHAGHQ